MSIEIAFISKEIRCLAKKLKISKTQVLKLVAIYDQRFVKEKKPKPSPFYRRDSESFEETYPGFTEWQKDVGFDELNALGYIPFRLFGGLVNYNARRVKDILPWTHYKLLQTKNIGEKSRRELYLALDCLQAGTLDQEIKDYRTKRETKT